MAEQLPLDFTASVSMRMRRAQKMKEQDAQQPQLFVTPPNIDVHLHSTLEAVAQIAGTDPDRTIVWLQALVGSVRIIKARRVAFPSSMLDRLLHVRPPATVTLDAACLAVARALWAKKLGLKPLKVMRDRQRLYAASPRWPKGFGVKDAPWPAIATLLHLGLPLDVDAKAKSLMTNKIIGAGSHIASAGLAGSAVTLEARMPTLLENLQLPALSYAGEASSGLYKMPLLSAECLLSESSIKLTPDLTQAIKKSCSPVKPLKPQNFPWTLYGFQAKDAARGMQILETTGGVLLAGMMGSGKALRNDQKVFTEKGLVAIKEITLNDKVLGKDGKYHQVTAVFPQEKKKMYEVFFSDGLSKVCDEEHLWGVGNGKGFFATLSLKEIQEDLLESFFWEVPYVSPPLNLNMDSSDSKNAYSLGKSLLRMPVFLFDATSEARLSFLQGFFDTHASIKENKVFLDFDLFLNMKEGLLFLIRSLGGNAFGNNVFLPRGLSPFKAKKFTSYKFSPIPPRKILDVKETAEDFATCISVAAKDQLYVLEDFVLTHNTTIALALLHEMDIWPVLVVAPLSAFSTWERQLGEMNKKLYLATEAPSKSWKMIEEGEYDAVVVSFDRLGAFSEVIERYGFKGIIADEIQRIRTPGSRRSRSLRSLAASVTYRIGLSGTPLTNSVQDLLPLGAFLAPGEWKPRANEKDLDDLYPGDPTESVAEHLGTLMVRRRMEDTGTVLPKRNDHRVFVQLTPEQRRALADLEAEAEAAKESGEFDDPSHKMHAFVRLHRARQIINCPSAAGIFGPNPKVQTALDLAEDFISQGRKGVIFTADRTTFREMGQALDKANIKWVGIWGSTSSKDRIKNEKQFHKDPETKIVLCTIQAGAESWSASPTGTFLISTAYMYQAAILEQMECRIYRLNSDLNGPDIEIIYTHAQAPGGSLDDRMVEILAHKKELFAQVVDRKSHQDSTKISYSMGDLVYLLTGKRDPKIDKLDEDKKNAVKREEDKKELAKNTLYAKKGKNKTSTSFHDQGEMAATKEEWDKSYEMEELLDLDIEDSEKAVLEFNKNEYEDLTQLEEDFDVEEGDDF